MRRTAALLLRPARGQRPGRDEHDQWCSPASSGLHNDERKAFVWLVAAESTPAKVRRGRVAFRHVAR